MRLAIMQPYFLPYLGYFQLISAVDLFILYDNIKYTKKGWINRNRLLRDGKDEVFTLPLRGASDSLDVCDREIATAFNRGKLLNQFRTAYQRAPHFMETFPLLEQIVEHDDQNLFRFLHHSILKVCGHLAIQTAIRVSSEINIDHSLKKEEKVFALCDAVGASTYVNAIGGMELYSKEWFQDRAMRLQFIQPKSFEYSQFENTFVPWLSIIDVLMFNSIDKTRSLILTDYRLT